MNPNSPSTAYSSPTCPLGGGSHSRSPDKMTHPLWGLRSGSCCRADKAMLKSAVPNVYRTRTPRHPPSSRPRPRPVTVPFIKCVQKTRS